MRYEYVIYDAKRKSIDTTTYSEKEISAALKKIKASKEATTNFGDKPTTKANIDNEVDDDDWGDGFDDDSNPWEE